MMTANKSIGNATKRHAATILDPKSKTLPYKSVYSHNVIISEQPNFLLSSSLAHVFWIAHVLLGMTLRSRGGRWTLWLVVFPA